MPYAQDSFAAPTSCVDAFCVEPNFLAALGAVLFAFAMTSIFSAFVRT